jgi:hypothetical protein
MQTGFAGCTPAALAGDDLISIGCVRVWPHQQGLEYAAKPYRLRQFRKSGWLDAAAWLVWIWLQQVERHLPHGGPLLWRLYSGFTEQRGKASTQPGPSVAPRVHA